MPIRTSGYYNNPQFAQAANNLMQLFKPPSGTDAAGWAVAKAKNAQAQRLSDFYNYLKDPNFNQQQFDRMGVAAGAFHPDQSYYSVDEGNATTRRGQDVAAATSRTNNAADNARAIDVAQMGDLKDLYGPLSPGQVRPEVPAEIAGRFGQPSAPIAAVAGAPKPQSEDELKAAILAGLPQDVQRAVAIGSTPVESVQTPTGPKIAYRSDAVGQTPYEKAGNGLSVTLPDGTVVQQGSGKAPTQAQGQLMNYTATARSMMPVLDELGAELTNPVEGASEASPSIGTLKPGNYMQSPKYQQARVAGERFVQSILRNESGAATPDAEIAKYQETLLPRPGDGPDQVKFKSWLRNVAVNAMAAGLGVNERKAEIDAAIAAGPPPAAANAAPTGAPAAPAPAPSQQPAGPARPQSDAEYNALPSGATFIDPADGKTYRKP
jgi:hypothetical protein